SGEVLSNKACATAWLNLNDPPRPITPANAAFIKPTQPQNIVFQWQTVNGLRPGTNLTEYRLELYELTDESTQPQAALHNGKAIQIASTDWQMSSSFIYDITQPALDMGKTYIYRIQGRDADGKDIFKNEGYSEIQYFHYGYPANRSITLRKPAPDHTYLKKEAKILSWTAPDKSIASQPFEYQVKVVEMEEDQAAEEAMALNPVWYSYTSAVQYKTNGLETPLGKALEPDKRYAWQVRAMSGDQEVAASPITSFYAPPFLQDFRVGNHTVTVVSLSKKDFSSLSGVCKIHLGDGDSITTPFENLEMFNTPLGWIVSKGVIEADMSGKEPIALSPEDPKNGSAYFHAQSLKLDRNTFELYGSVYWPLPHAALSPDKPVIKTQPGWAAYNKLKLMVAQNLADDQSFTLLDPYDLRLRFDPYSRIYVSNNEFKVLLYGQVDMPASIPNARSKEERISLEFRDKSQFYYFSHSPTGTAPISLVKRTGIELQPITYTLDLDEEQSPPLLADDKGWKGIYMDRSKVILQAALDEARYLALKSGMEEELVLGTQSPHKAWVGRQGMDFSYASTLSPTEDQLYVHSFSSKLLQWHVQIENNRLTESRWQGDFIIPFLSTRKRFAFSAELLRQGFAPPVIDDAADYRFTHSPEGGDQRAELRVLQARFEDNRIDMAFDIEWPALKLKLEKQLGFSIWSNYAIGFGGTPNAAISLSRQVEGSVDGFNLTAEGIGAGSSGGMYSLALATRVQMSDDVAGPEGPPLANIYSMMPNTYAEQASKAGASIPDMPGGSAKGSVSEQVQDQTAAPVKPEEINEASRQAEATTEKLKQQLTQSGQAEAKWTGPSEDELMAFLGSQHVEMDFSPSYIWNQANNRQKDFLISLLADETSVVTDRLKEKVDKIEGAINDKIKPLESKAGEHLASSINTLVDAVRNQFINLSSDPDIQAEINEGAERMKLTLKDELRGSLHISIQNNITGKVSRTFSVLITNRLSEVAFHAAVSSFSGNGSVEDAVLAELDRLGAAFLQDLHEEASLENTVNGLANDLVANVNTQRISSELKQILQNVGAAVLTKHAGAIVDKAGEWAEKLNIKIPMDFGNLAEKGGKLKKVLAMDPVPINLKTKFISFSGLIHYQPLDPTYGNVWRGEVELKVNVPKKFSVKGYYTNGKKDGSSYWFCQISPAASNLGAMQKGVAALDKPASLGGVQLVGVNGWLYRKMRSEGNRLVPDKITTRTPTSP
ncbi:MAG: hypothetical protein HC842_07185, partial [Cytophagales bacterium]|nr:hypothetical protein [Cytophagales bacterium]